MKYIIQAVVGGEDQTDFECDAIPFVPNIGDQVTLVTKGGPTLGIVQSRRFNYFSKGGTQTCGVLLVCDPIHA
jgi:hypothetical protein